MSDRQIERPSTHSLCCLFLCPVGLHDASPINTKGDSAFKAQFGGDIRRTSLGDAQKCHMRTDWQHCCRIDTARSYESRPTTTSLHDSTTVLLPTKKKLNKGTQDKPLRLALQGGLQHRHDDLGKDKGYTTL